MQSSFLKTVSEYRWYVAGAIGVLIVGSLVFYAFVPLFQIVHQKTVKEVRTYNALKHDTALPERVAEIKKENSKVSQILATLQSKKGFNETEILAEIYSVVDSVSFTLTKLQVGEPIKGSVGTEVPLEIEGHGNYNSIGNVVSHVEQMDRFSRIIVCSIRKQKENALKLSLSVRVLEVP